MEDLRAEVEVEWGDRPVQERAAFMAGVQGNGPLALDGADGALWAYAEKLTRTPARMTEGDVQHLRRAGFDDVQIHDAIQVISYFNYINRVADAVDVELEPEYPSDPRRPGESARPGDTNPNEQ